MFCPVGSESRVEGQSGEPVSVHTGSPAKPLLKTWHLVALFGRNDILFPFLADANESLRSFDILTFVGGRTVGSADINRGDRDSVVFSRGSMRPFPRRRRGARGCVLVEILAVGFYQCAAVDVRDQYRSQSSSLFIPQVKLHSSRA